MLVMEEEPAVLGISAARTIGKPSGVALWQLKNRTWRCVRVAPSYASFCSEVAWHGEISAEPVDVAALMQACRRLLGAGLPTVVAASIPLGRTPVAGRRNCDRLMHEWFSRRGISIRRPTSRSPSQLGLRFYQRFREAGFRLVTKPGAYAGRSLIEVNPDVALLTLLGRSRGPRYKALNTRAYWPGLSPRARAQLLLQEWRSILWRLGKHARAVDLPLPTFAEQSSFVRLQRYQDAIEALACAWMGTQFLAGTLRPIGDDAAAVWIPLSAEMTPKAKRSS